jgi:GT2 family glycosyltransferase
MSNIRNLGLSVVVTTYQWPEALDLTLTALSETVDPDVQIVVADDGSARPTQDVVDRWHSRFGERFAYVRQSDEGYRRARVLNLGALAATKDYLLFLDGDCLLRRGWLTVLRRAALPGWFLASKRLNLGPDLSRRVLEERLPVWRWSAAEWLVRAPRELVSSPRELSRPGMLLPARDRRRPWRPGSGDFTPPFSGYGFFFGVRRDDFDRVNGFDQRFESWGGEDVDLAERLRRHGLTCGWPGPRATALHLWHPGRKGTGGQSNRGLLEDAEHVRRVEAAVGLRELAAELAGTQVSAKRVGASSPSTEPENR